MNLPRYELKAEKSLMVFEFTSEGPKGQIPKLIKFSETTLEGFYNLAFGDKNLETGDIEDTVVSNNGDNDQVLATVVRQFIRLQKKKMKYGFTPQEAQNHGHDFTEWELPNILTK